MSKHTPGPWIMEESFQSIWIWSPGKEKIICRVNQDDDYKDHVKESNIADMKLVVRAPELLAENAELKSEKAHLLEIIQALMNAFPAYTEYTGWEDDELEMTFEKAYKILG